MNTQQEPTLEEMFVLLTLFVLVFVLVMVTRRPM